MSKLLTEIKERCDKRELQTRLSVQQVSLFDDDGEEVKRNRQHLIVSIPEERESKNIVIITGEELRIVHKSKFEQYRFIKGYEACWSEEQQAIECELQADESLPRPPRFILRRLLSFIQGKKELVEERNGKPYFVFPSPNDKLKILIGESSSEFSILTNYKRDLYLSSSRLYSRITLRIEGISVSTHDEAINSLLKIGNAVLFQIDLNTNMPLHLTIDKDLLRDFRKRKTGEKTINFNPPKFEYDKETMSLYWYARTSVNMPLLQFLAYYQILEFYFPSFSYTEAQQKIKNLIKSPLFDSNKDTDVAQIINIIKVSSKGKSIGDERAQLKATIHHVVDNNTLLRYLTENNERKDFYDVTKKTKSLAKQKISFANHEHDIRNDVAERIYEIRCRIVHTKDEVDLELILPTSTELIHLKHDLELIEFIAKKTLISTSRPLKI